MEITVKYDGNVSFSITNKVDYYTIKNKINKNDLLNIKINKPRNRKHHNKYWLLMEALSFHFEDSPEDIDRYFKKKFIGVKIRHNNKLNIDIEIQPSIAFRNRDQVKFEEYYKQVEDFLLAKGYTIDQLITNYKESVA